MQHIITHLRPINKFLHGMIPKLDNAFTAIEQGVAKVVIGNADELAALITGKAGTTIQHG
jgi:acetylglutamate kinase